MEDTDRARYIDGLRTLAMPNEIWYDATLYVRRPGSPGVPDRRIQVDARTSVKLERHGAPRLSPTGVRAEVERHRRDAAKSAAETRFRELGLGAVMDLPDATVTIDVVPL